MIQRYDTNAYFVRNVKFWVQRRTAIVVILTIAFVVRILSKNPQAQ